MEIERQELSPICSCFIFTIPKNEYEPELIPKLKEQQRVIHMKGFRQGKTPMHIVKRLVGSELEHKITYELLVKGFIKALREQNIITYWIPFVHKAKEDNGDIKFEVSLVHGPRTLEEFDYSKLDFVSYETEASEDDIKRKFTEARLRKGKRISVEKIKQSSADISYSIQCVAEVKEPKAGEDIPEEQNINIYLGLLDENIEALFIGKVVGDVVECEKSILLDISEYYLHTFNSYEDDELILLNIKKIEIIDLPELDAEFLVEEILPEDDYYEYSNKTKDELFSLATDYLKFEIARYDASLLYFWNLKILEDYVDTLDISIPEEHLQKTLPEKTQEEIEELAEDIKHQTIYAYFVEKELGLDQNDLDDLVIDSITDDRDIKEDLRKYIQKIKENDEERYKYDELLDFQIEEVTIAHIISKLGLQKEIINRRTLFERYKQMRKSRRKINEMRLNESNPS